MSEPNYPTIDALDLKKAQQDRANTVFLAVTGVSTVATIQAALNRSGPGPLNFLAEKFTGVKVTPSTTGGGGRASIPTLSVYGALLPAPVGYVPAEIYGLHPDVVMKFLGFRMGSKPPVLNATDTRIKVFEARERAKEIMARFPNITTTSVYTGEEGPLVPAGPIPVTRFELEYLRSLPVGTNADVETFLAETADREADFPPSLAGFFERNSAVQASDLGEVQGHLVNLIQPGGDTVEGIETPAGEFLRIDAAGRAMR